MPDVSERLDQLVHSPVFVDSTGRRRGWVKVALVAVAVICIVYLGLVVFSFMGGPITPRDLLPWPKSAGSSRGADGGLRTRVPAVSGPATSAPGSAGERASPTDLRGALPGGSAVTGRASTAPNPAASRPSAGGTSPAAPSAGTSAAPSVPAPSVPSVSISVTEVPSPTPTVAGASAPDGAAT